MASKKQTPWLLIGLSAAALGLATLYVLQSRKPSLMERMQQPATGIDLTSDRSHAECKEQETACNAQKKSAVFALTDPCCVDYIKNCSEPCVLKFYTTWCGACTHLASYFDDVAKEFEGKVTFYSVDCDNRELMKKIEEAHLIKNPIAAIPTIVYLQNGKVHEQEQGAPTKDVLIEKVKKAFAL